MNEGRELEANIAATNDKTKSVITLVQVADISANDNELIIAYRFLSRKFFDGPHPATVLNRTIVKL